MKVGDFVAIEYVGRLETGEIFDLTDEELAKKEKIYNPNYKYGPVVVIVGAGFVIPGLDEVLLKMKVGEERKVEIEPEKGFGQRNPNLVKIIPERFFRNEPKPGMVCNISGMIGRVQSVSAGRVRVDFNNPLAGKKLIYNIKIVRKIDDKMEKINSVFKFFGLKPKINIKNGELEVEGKINPQLKERIGNLITKYVEGVNKVRFVEVFERESDKKGDSFK